MREKSIEYLQRKLITLGRVYQRGEINEHQYTTKCYEVFKKTYFMHEKEIMDAYNDGNTDNNYALQNVQPKFYNADDYFIKTYPE